MNTQSTPFQGTDKDKPAFPETKDRPISQEGKDKTAFQEARDRATSQEGRDKTAYPEGPVARAIEKQTAKVPSDVFLWLAGASIAGSAVLKVMEAFKPSVIARGSKGNLSVFVGMWAPTLLILGLYNKLVKVAGSDRQSN